MTEHTRGPWRSQGWVPTWAYIPVMDARHNRIAFMYPDPGHNYTREECEANARLIAAAPEMLHTLIACVEHMEWSNPKGQDAYQAARAIIAGATGGKKLCANCARPIEPELLSDGTNACMACNERLIKGASNAE